jgi:hypothetical protein
MIIFIIFFKTLFQKHYGDWGLGIGDYDTSMTKVYHWGDIIGDDYLGRLNNKIVP